MFFSCRMPEEGRRSNVQNARSAGFTGSVQDWSLGRHGDPKNAYGIVVDARTESM